MAYTKFTCTGLDFAIRRQSIYYKIYSLKFPTDLMQQTSYSVGVTDKIRSNCAIDQFTQIGKTGWNPFGNTSVGFDPFYDGDGS